MPNHPNRGRSKLAQYGARLRTTDGRKTVELVDPNDNAKRRFQFRLTPMRGLERRVLRSDGEPMLDGSPWQELSTPELAALIAVRGQYHPILDPLGL